MAVKVIGTTVIDDSRNITNINTTSTGNTTITGFVNVSSTALVYGNSSLLGANNTVNANFRVVNSTANAFYVGSNGNIGIGTSTPAEKLEVIGGLARFADDTTPVNEGDGAAYFGKTGGKAFVSSAGGFTVRDNGTTRLTVNSEYITATVALSVLSVEGQIADALNPAFTNGSEMTGMFFPVYNTVGFTADGTETMRITPTGNVGIGNTAPTHKLRVEGTTSLAGDVSDVTTLTAGNSTIRSILTGNNIAIRADGAGGNTSLVTSANSIYFSQLFSAVSAAGTNSFSFEFTGNTSGAGGMTLTRVASVGSNSITSVAPNGISGYNTNSTAGIDTTKQFQLYPTQFLLANGVIFYANNTAGTAGQVLTTSGSGVYWSTVSGLTSIIAGTGLSGGTITTSGSTISVNAAYIGTLSANNTTFVNGKTEGNLNVNSAAQLSTSRNINGVGFNGTSDILVPSSYDANYRRITNPGGAEYVSQASPVTGALQVTLPVGYTNTMMRMTIKVFDYTTNESFDVICGGYNYAPGTTWAETFAYILGNPSIDRRFTVRFGFTAGGKCCVYIGELASVWAYPQFYVTDVQLGYSGMSASWVSGWATSVQASAFENVTSTIAASQIGYATSTNTTGAVVLRDGSGNFSANNITATNLSGGSVSTTGITIPSTDTERTVKWNFTGRDVYIFGRDSDDVVGLYDTVGGLRWTSSATNVFYAPTMSTGGLTSTGRIYSNEWIQMDNYSGLYSPYNNAHFYPNNGTYGSWYCRGTRNGWAGIEFYDSSTTLMMNTDGYGFHWNGVGWRMYVSGGSLYVPGDITAYWSDRRLKENLKPIGSEAAEILSKLTAYRFNWNDKVDNFGIDVKPGKEEIGLIAQEVQAVLPDAVAVNKTGSKLDEKGNTVESDYLTIRWNKITPLLVQALNDTTKKLDDTTRELNDLKQLLKDKGIL